MKFCRAVELINLESFQRKLEREGEAFLKHVFTAAERRYCETKRTGVESYGARYAAKKAMKRVLGIKASEFCWRDVEVLLRKNGKPYFNLKKLKQKKYMLSTGAFLDLSLAHERRIAVATVLMSNGTSKG